MRRHLAAVLAAALVVASCGGGEEESAQRSTTTTTGAVAADGVLEVLGSAEIDSLEWWSAVPGQGLIVVFRELGSGNGALVTVDPAGTESVIVESMSLASKVKVAPDGSTVAVVEPVAGRGYALWTIPTDGGPKTIIDEAEATISLGDYTADSSRLIYRILDERPSLHSAALDGSKPLTLVRAAAGERDPVLGPPTIVGERLVYATDDDENGVRIWSSRVDQPLRTRVEFADGLRTVWRITAAADGRHALIEADVRGLSSDRALFTAWADGRGPAILLDEGGKSGVASVDSDGDDAVYRIGQDWFFASLSGLSSGPLVKSDVEVPGFAFVDSIVPSSDGGWVFTSAFESGERELYHFDPGSEEVLRVNRDLETHRGVLGGTAMDWVLDFELLGDGAHVAYTTGLDGESARITYRLYIAPLP